ncbi:pilus assembly protein PilV [Paucibacter sp. B2R-40]|uniref:type IV pilus modification PilV family protein n=1 Tax=Paucibacter sp. B2R-40 TaxID=2893554 RepID=UPI0021E4A216|nr:pilus assembly protein PilV [Paucibacter sp. B2R-40]MCV2356197.1 pilus assembly protein PilV [Paucibacter sp. B2R-40]
MKHQLKSRSQAARPGERGVAMIEALVGILIFAFGVLGLVGLQATMTKAQTGAKFRADAANASQELIGVMWSDSAANLSKYSTANCATYARCKEWSDKLKQLLPGAATAVVVDGASGEVTITISWTQAGEGNHSFTSSAMVVLL